LNYFCKEFKTTSLSAFKKIRISDFSYDLPEERIAKYPLPERDRSNLLIWNNGAIQKESFRNIASYLPKNALLVFNNTRVIHARLFFRKSTGARIEIFCLEPVEPADHQLAFQQTGMATWKCMVGNAKKWKDEALSRHIEIAGKTIELKARKTGQEKNTFLIEFCWDPPYTFGEIIEKSGIIPIPPYLNRETEPGDETAYQTIYAKTHGSVAAPTAGLHFTEETLARLTEKQIDLSEITLHVGAGTFQPVKSETIDEHTMHREQVVIPRAFIKKLLAHRDKVIAVGTTSVRSLESLYWLALKLSAPHTGSDNMQIGQWDPYEYTPSLSAREALKSLLKYLDETGKETLQFSTQVMIVPGYDFKMIEGMITNFHQPQSTLLLLISAFLGDDWKKVYDFALQHDFRFLSYGDSNLYLR
jgi:S-adenosylmethionine:tRNA ribosyltransferase-isomerase